MNRVCVCVKMRLKPILYSSNSNKFFEHSFDLIFRDQNIHDYYFFFLVNNIHDYKPTIDVKCRVLKVLGLSLNMPRWDSIINYQIFFLSPSQLRLFSTLEYLGGQFIALRRDINSKVLGSNLHI